jgi:4Fe-4S iron-sulfur cluster binding domain/DR2241 stabilising domain
MAGPTNPALAAFLAELNEGFTFAQVRISPIAGGYELRHIDDSAADASTLAPIEIANLRALSQTTANGAFRPNKAAPNLRRGWQASAQGAEELETALRLLYPGALADWFTARLPSPPVTAFREFMARQTGLYRITQILPDTLAAQTVRACCAPSLCLRRRLWSAPAEPPERAAAKSVIPCLEPCALLLDLARRAMKLEQESKADLAVAQGDVAVLLHALETALAHPSSTVREGSSTDPRNPRRLRLLLEKLRPHLPEQMPIAE